MCFMVSTKDISIDFQQGLSKLGFDADDALFLVNAEPDELEILFHLYTAEKFGATAVYLRKQLNGSYKPQVYLFDKTDNGFNNRDESELAEIQKKIWTSGEVPLVCIFYNTDVAILDCTKHITKDYKPEYLVESLNTVGKAQNLYNKHFAIKIKTGIFWEQEELKNKFKFQNSAYDRLIENIKIVERRLSEELENTSTKIITKIIVQSILIKYLEERIDKEGNKLLSVKYFKKYDNADTFNDVLKKGKFVELLNDLNDEKTGFNGNVFKWETEEIAQLNKLNLSIVAELLATDKFHINSKQAEIKFPDWRYFEFQFIPVELISRLYEEFLGENKQEKGLYYTPSHLAKLLVDECLPLKKYQDINLADFTILDPACGSGIFLVVAFKRLVQIWKLQNEMKRPAIDDLKLLLRNIYGVDKEEQAIRLSSFSLSLALCDELEPKKIIDELKFDDLQKENLICSDFFVCKKIKNKKFNLVIGNPPYVRGGTRNFDDNKTKINGEIVEIPNNQIALKFLGDSFCNLKQNGLQCLLVKSSGVLYNSTSQSFMKILFSKTNVIQILDFTGLARNKALWDNQKEYITDTGKIKQNLLEVETAAIFIRNEKPDFTKNILHLTFRRTKSTKERIVFEVDDYDMHFVNRQNAMNNMSIWKINLLGGGRIKITIEKLTSIGTLQNLFNGKGIYGEGAGGAKSLPNEAFFENRIDDSFITSNYNASFNGKKDKPVYAHPNFLIKENIDLPFCLNNNLNKFSNEIVGFHSTDTKLLGEISDFFRKYHDVLKFFNICTSGKMLVYKNTACKQEDILSLPIDLTIDLSTLLSDFDFNIIHDVNNILQFFLRRGENSDAVKPVEKKKIVSVLSNYGTEFSKALNFIYETEKRKFRLSDVVELKNSLFATIFKYDSVNDKPMFHRNDSALDIVGLTNHEISSQLSVSRIIKLYPQKDTIVFVKPNQYRYWLSLTAYRDADKCFSDFADAGF
ncbi:putative type I restriction enzymeP M protein [termite gut metagenome]|uniref:site-specific DNA-methyltransferase (adenine-specific) n=1 Tax=termite gut metagenome TaxID=433724 RepID=A0A5J4S8L8_9ZZZZ